jgi:hypothetical protein
MQAFDALLNSLDSSGIRESHLRLMLLKIENIFKENVQKNAIIHQHPSLLRPMKYGGKNVNLKLTFVISISTFIAWKTHIVVIAILL